jgi:rhodanese-related sulfurtransferase
MKRKTTILVLVLTLCMIVSAFPAFASYYKEGGIESLPTIQDEVGAETFAMNLAGETAEGKYRLINTADLKKDVDGKSAIIVDTMPAGWYAKRHIPGAINAFAPLKGETYTAADKANLLNQVKKLSGTKTVKQYYNSKTKKWQNKKPAKKYWNKCKKGKYKGKKTRTVTKPVMDKKIIIYCGFVKCTRSHMAAAYLVSQGYTNVYRQPGGISAWADAGLPMEGTNPGEVLDEKTLDPSSDRWASYGIPLEKMNFGDFIIDVRSKSDFDAGHIAGSVNFPVTGDYDEDELLAEYNNAGGKRVVIICVRGKSLAAKAMKSLQKKGADMGKVTYLIGGATGLQDKGILVPTASGSVLSSTAVDLNNPGVEGSDEATPEVTQEP